MDFTAFQTTRLARSRGMSRRQMTGLVLAPVMIALSGCRSPLDRALAEACDMEANFGKHPIDEVLGDPRMKRILQDSPQVGAERFFADEQVVRTAALSRDQAASTTAILTNPKTYSSMTLCMFTPGMRLRYQTHEGVLDVIICLVCQDLMYKLDGKVVTRNLSFAHSKIHYSDKAWHALVNLARQAFPQDALLRQMRHGRVEG